MVKDNRNYKQILKLSQKAEKEQRLTKKQQEKQGKTYIRDSIAGAYYIDNRTYITDGFWGLIFADKIENLQMIPQNAYSGLELEKIVPPYLEREKLDIKDFDKFVEELKEKAKNKETEDKYIKIGKSWYNAEYVLNVIKCFDECEIWQETRQQKYNSLVVISGNDKGVICPVRKDD